MKASHVLARKILRRDQLIILLGVNTFSWLMPKSQDVRFWSLKISKSSDDETLLHPLQLLGMFRTSASTLDPDRSGCSEPANYDVHNKKSFLYAFRKLGRIWC